MLGTGQSVRSSAEAGESRGSEGTQGDECVMTKRTDQRLTTVPFGATPARKPVSVKEWANRCVWTDRMLSALQSGVRGGKWHTLMDKVQSKLNLFTSSESVLGNEGACGVDHQTVEQFRDRQMSELRRLEEELRMDTYRPRAVKRVMIAKLGSTEKRPLGIPCVRDRVVQTALLHVLEPIFDATFAEHSYGFRPSRGCHHALERVEALLNEGFVHVVDADLKSYFDTIPKDRLLSRVGERVSDSRVLRLVEQFLEQGVMDGLREWVPTMGTPQGAVISPLLANIYLNPLDHRLAEAGFAMVRYADDFVILCRSREDAERALSSVRQWVEENGLTLHPTKTKIVDASTEGFDFLGYTFRGELRLPRQKSLAKLKDSVRAKTARTHGHCLAWIVTKLNLTLHGWFGYFRHCHRNVFRDLDRWIRGRLRSILRRRQRRRGRARGKDHQRWPNVYFANRGLYSLYGAFGRLHQSQTR
jgi:RNA-directed DNA polymerase